MLNLKEKFGNKLKENELMRNHTTFKIGGPARYFLEVESSEELIRTVETAKKERIGYIIIGNGSNLLVSDQGFGGLVIKMVNDKCQMIPRDPFGINGKLVVGAGLSLEKLSQFAMENGLTGMEWAYGVPGTVGGAIVMNAGCYGSEMKDGVVKVKYFDGQAIEKLTNRQCEFRYRESIFKTHSNWIILEAELKLDRGDKEEIKRKTQEYLEQRNQKLPKEPSAGSIFKKYEVAKKEKLNENLERILQKEHPEFLNNRYIPAGWLIEEAGLKGKKIGGAQISEKHGNFIVNTGKATAEDVVILIAIIKEKVRNELGVQLQEEVMYLGF